MSFIDRFISKEKEIEILDKHFKDYLENYISKITVKDKSNKEKCKYKIMIESDNSPDELSFDKEYFASTKKDAEEIGKLHYVDGNKIEIWKLVKRY